jgi:cytochrome c-type biogenesis protein CcmH/NrfG
MAAWLPVIKVVLPYLAPVFQAAIPALTKKSSDKADPLVSQQISELQEAVKTNSESTKTLAKAIEEAAEANDRTIKRLRIITGVALLVAVLALGLAMAALY